MKKQSQTIYTLAILEKYQTAKKDIYMQAPTPKRLKYDSMQKMLKESMLLGATKFGINYIF